MEQGTTTKHYRVLGWSLIGAVLVIIGLAFIYQGYHQQAGGAPTFGSAYQYTVKQSADAAVRYFDSSFFANKTPGIDNPAYISDLTDEIEAQFRYSYSANQPTKLTSIYDVKAQVQATYAIKGSSENSSNVWQKDYQLVPPTTASIEGTDITLTPKVTIPFADYKRAATEFRTALLLPTTSQVMVMFTVRVTGTVDGAPINDTRTSTITAPLEEQVYQPAIKFDKEDTRQVIAASAKEGQARTAQVEWVSGLLLLTGGALLIAYGMRKRIFKSPYQRELDKIYRYHDGLIVRTSRPIDLTDYQIIPMRSFADMLNLEEELKKPIIADEISSSLTHFLIASSNVMYLYKLQTEKAISSRSLTPTAAAPPAQPATATAPSKVRTYGLAPALSTKPITQQVQAPPKRALGSHDKKPITVKNHDELDDIISEMTKKPSKK